MINCNIKDIDPNKVKFILSNYNNINNNDSGKYLNALINKQ